MSLSNICFLLQKSRKTNVLNGKVDYNKGKIKTSLKAYNQIITRNRNRN